MLLSQPTSGGCRCQTLAALTNTRAPRTHSSLHALWFVCSCPPSRGGEYAAPAALAARSTRTAHERSPLRRRSARRWCQCLWSATAGCWMVCHSIWAVRTASGAGLRRKCVQGRCRWPRDPSCRPGPCAASGCAHGAAEAGTSAAGWHWCKPGIRGADAKGGGCTSGCSVYRGAAAEATPTGLGPTSAAICT
jgi:hypothetical protein